MEFPFLIDLMALPVNVKIGKVFKGKKMAGRLGNKKVTTQNLLILKIDTKNDLLIVKRCSSRSQRFNSKSCRFDKKKSGY